MRFNQILFDQTKFLPALLLLAAVALSSCGGASTPPAVVSYYTIGGTFVVGGGKVAPAANLVLRNNRGDDLIVVAGATNFTFATKIASGTAYDVTVYTQPTSQFCTVSSGVGTASANVTSVSLSCIPAYTIGGTITGLTGTGLIMHLNGGGSIGENLSIPALATTFTFKTLLSGTGFYAVTELSRPKGPSQECTLTGNSGFMTGANYSGIAVTCFNSALLDKPRYAYVANSTDNTVSGYIVDDVTGQLRPNGYVFVGANTSPRSVTVDPSGRFAYVANGGNGSTVPGSVSTYTIGTNGRLTSVPPTVAAGNAPGSVTVDPSGLHAYVTNTPNSDDVTVYDIDLLTGALTRVPCLGGLANANCSGSNLLNYTTGTNPTSISVAPAGQYAYVAHGSGVSGYSIDLYGALTSLGASTTAGTNPNSVSIDPSGKFLYVANGSSTNVSGYTISSLTGALTGFGAVAAGSNPRSVTVDPYGNYAYVANYGTGLASSTVSAYTIDATFGTLASLGSLVTGGNGPSSVIVDPSGKFAYVANDKSADISGYTIDTVTVPGALITPSNMRARAGSISIAMTKGTNSVAYSPKYAYVANSGTGDVSGYAIDAGTGALTPMDTDAVTPLIQTTIAALAGTNSVTVDPTGRFVYVTNGGVSNSISGYTIGTGGALTAMAGNPYLPGGSIGAPSSISIDPSGRFAYIANNATHNVTAFTIDTSTGALSEVAGSPFANGTGTGPSAVTIDPTGRFAYVANNGDASVSAYLIDPSSGVLSRVTCTAACSTSGNFMAGLSPSSVTIDPSGKFAYVVNDAGSSVSVFSISAADGSLTSAWTKTTAAGPKSITIDPTGKFAYVAVSSGNKVEGYSIDAGTGALTFIDMDTVTVGPQSITTGGTGPKSVTVDISGNYLYVVNDGGGIASASVSAFSINTTTGVLTSLGAATVTGATSASVSVATTGTNQ